MAVQSQPVAPSRKALVLIIMTVILNGLGFTLIIPIAPFLVARYTGDANALGLAVAALTSIYAVCQFVAAPGLGALSDRYGRRPILLICLLGSAIGYLLLGVGGALWVLFLGRAIDGLTGANNAVLSAYLADVVPPAQRARYYGLVGALASICIVIGPAVGGLLAQMGVAIPLFLAAAVSLTNFLIGLLFMPESLPEDGRAASIQVAKLNPFSALGDVLALSHLRWLLIAVFVYTLVFLALPSNLSLFVRDTLHWGTTAVGPVFSVFGVVSIAAQGALLPFLLKRLGTARVAVFGLVISGAGFLLTALAVVQPLAAVIYAGVTVLAIGEGLVSPTLLELVSRGADERSQGKVQGGNQSMQSLANIAGPLMVGVLYDKLGHAAPYLIATGGVVVALGVLSLALPALNRYTGSVESAA